MVTMRPPNPVPRGATARRPSWSDLPAAVRRAVAKHLGAPVTQAVSQGSGFTPGFASRLQLGDGRRYFVKAAGEDTPWVAAAYREEALKRALLPDGVPAPGLHAIFTVHASPDWVVLVFDDVRGAPPHRPWRLDQAAAALRTVGGMSASLTPAPAGHDWRTVAQELTGPDHSPLRLADHPDWRWRYAELSGLIDRADQLLTGDTLTHLDLRDDNVIVDEHGTIWICDWNYPAIGPRWTDAVCLGLSIFGDGLDVDALLATHAGLEPSDAEGVDCLLAVLLAYFVGKAGQAAISTSPYLRSHQAWYAEVTGAWLRQRRGWPSLD